MMETKRHADDNLKKFVLPPNPKFADQNDSDDAIPIDPDKIVAVLGSGDYGRAISSRLGKSAYKVYMGSRDHENSFVKKLVRKTGAIFVSQADAILSAKIIILAVSRDHYDHLPTGLFKNKVLVDVSNSTSKSEKESRYRSNAEYLQDICPDAEVVKGFNVLSAYSLESGGIQGSKEVFIASDFPEAKASVATIVRDMGFYPIDLGTLSAARDIEDMPLRLMPSWKRPVAVVFGIFVFLWIIALFQFQICKNIASGKWHQHWQHVTLMNLNRVLGILALWTLSFCYLPGLFAAYLQLWRGTKYRRFPNWLDRWLKMRKQLGLLALGVAGIHACLSLGFISPQTVTSVFEPPQIMKVQTVVNKSIAVQDLKIYSFQYNWTGGLFLTFAALSFCLMVVLGISSLPSVTAGLTWREFDFIQSKLGWILLIFSSLHDIFLGYDFMFIYWACFNTMPLGPQFALYPPFICVVLKIPLLIPPVANYLAMIRRGFDRTRKQKIETA